MRPGEYQNIRSLTPLNGSTNSSSILQANEPTVAVSVVIPVFNEEKLLEELFTRLMTVMHKIKLPFEVVFIDDGSNDSTFNLLRSYTDSEPEVRAVRLSRNFGQQTAFSAGLDLAQGKAVVLMDGDLQDSPEAIEQFVERWREGNEVVFAIRKDRRERTSKRWAYTVFYKILSWLADTPIPRDAGDFCLLDRKVVMQLRSMHEHHRFLRGMRSWVGFKQTGIPIERGARYSGSPKYTLRKLLRLAFDGFLTSSTLPLRSIAFVGLLLSVVATVVAILYIYWKITSGVGPPGFATLVVIVCFFSGIQLMLLGIVGEYVGRIFEQVRGRPTYIVDEVVERNGDRAQK